jgi:hypothetical protein
MHQRAVPSIGAPQLARRRGAARAPGTQGAANRLAPLSSRGTSLTPEFALHCANRSERLEVRMRAHRSGADLGLRGRCRAGEGRQPEHQPERPTPRAHPPGS